MGCNPIRTVDLGFLAVRTVIGVEVFAADVRGSFPRKAPRRSMGVGGLHNSVFLRAANIGHAEMHTDGGFLVAYFGNLRR